MKRLAYLLLLALVWLTACQNQPATRTLRPRPTAASVKLTTDFPIGLSLVPEMDYIPEVDSWEECAPEDYPDDTQKVRSDWKLLCSWVASRLPIDTVRSLSRWAKPQMQNYARVPPLFQVELMPFTLAPDKQKLVYEGTIDTLPTYNPKVSRWLKLFVLYDVVNRKILRATITIRGEVQE